jgi:hypothetical protein
MSLAAAAQAVGRNAAPQPLRWQSASQPMCNTRDHNRVLLASTVSAAVSLPLIGTCRSAACWWHTKGSMLTERLSCSPAPWVLQRCGRAATPGKPPPPCGNLQMWGLCSGIPEGLDSGRSCKPIRTCMRCSEHSLSSSHEHAPHLSTHLLRHIHVGKRCTAHPILVISHLARTEQHQGVSQHRDT